MFLGGIFCAFWDILQKNRVGSFFIWTLHMLCGIYGVYVFNESRTVMYIGMGCYNRQQYYCDGNDDIVELLFILFV